jgi:prephenate dehydrogenase
MNMLNKIGFIGLGLIGGSIAKAAKKNNLAKTLVAYDLNRSALVTAQSEGIIDQCATQIDESFADCNIIFLCCPISINIATYKQLSSIVNDSCIITDVGSTKSEIVEAIEGTNKSLQFIGGHPMVGSEKSGYTASKTYLFENAYYIMTPTQTTSKESIQVLEQFISDIKAIPIIISPQYHDFVTAVISHVPHVIASSLVNCANALDDEDHLMHLLAAGGFKDLTRIASSSPKVWENICLSNSINIVNVIDYFIDNMTAIKKAISQNNPKEIYQFFDEAKSYRDSIPVKISSSLPAYFSIFIDVEDEMGIISKITTILFEHKISIKSIGVVSSREFTNGILEIVFYDKSSVDQGFHLLSELNYAVYQ